MTFVTNAQLAAFRRDLASRTQCEKCGKPKAAIATEHRGSGSGGHAGAHYSPTRFLAQCDCPPAERAEGES